MTLSKRARVSRSPYLPQGRDVKTELVEAALQVIRTYDEYVEIPELSGKVEPHDIARLRAAVSLVR